MPIVARVNPETANRIGAAPQVRATTQVQPVQGLTQVADQFAGLAQGFFEKEKKRNDLTAVMAARRELSDWEGATFDPANEQGIGAFKGRNALGANEALLPDLDKRVSEIGGRLTPEQRAQFDQVAFSFRDSVQGRLNGHMQREHEAFLSAEQKATTSNLVNDATQAALDGDFGLAATRATELLAMNRAALTVDGMPEELIKASERELVSGVHAQVIDGMLARDPLQAQAYMDRYEGQMSAAHRTNATNALRPFVEDAAAEAIATDSFMGISGQAIESIPGGYPALRDKLESGGDPKAFNKASGAAGKHQFLASTWAGLVEQHRPAWSEGLSKQEILDKRFDPEASDEMVEHFDRANTAELSRRGLPVTDINLYLAHHFGAAGGSAIIQAPGSTPMKALVSAAAYKANPHLQGKTKDQAIAAFAERAGVAPAAMGAVESGQSQTVQVSPPKTEGEALERVRDDPRSRDPRILKAAETKIRQQWAQREQDRAQVERDTQRSIHLAVEDADPRAPLRQALGANFAFAEANGMLEGLEKRRRDRIAGTLTQTDPALFDELHREALLTPDKFRERVLDPGTLSANDLSAMMKLQQDLNNPAKVAQFATDAQLLDAEFDKLGIADNKKTKGVNEASVARGQYQSAFLLAREGFIKANGGREPTADESAKMLRQLTLSRARTRGTPGADAPGDRPLFQRLVATDNGGEFAVPEDRRAAVVADLRGRGISNPSEFQIRARWAAELAAREEQQ